MEYPTEPMRLMLIGAGYHARDVYLPLLATLQREGSISLAAVVDFESVLSNAKEFLRSLGLNPSPVAAMPFSSDQLPREFDHALRSISQTNHITAVIIATPPETHKAYALWAMDMGLSILMDKPITTRPNAANNLSQALAIYRDYQELLAKYNHLQRHKSTAFMVHTTRRFHPAFGAAVQLIREIQDRTNCPVTSVYSSHADGQWRFPNELIDIDYHGYNQGVGVISHTGYHIIDIAFQLQAAGEAKDKHPDRIDIFASLVKPIGILSQFNARDYERMFPQHANHFRHTTYEPHLASYGEVDAFISTDLWREDVCIGHVTIEVLHNSFSQRSRATPNYEDLYKGMGRLNQEFHSVQQGPFQNVQMHSFQSKSPQSPSDQSDIKMGGNNHRDLLVFRNSNLLGGKAYQRLSIDDMMQFDPASSVAKLVENLVVEEFIAFLRGKIDKSRLRSNIDSHWLPTAVMSGAYAAYARRAEGEYPIVTLDLSNKRLGVIQRDGFHSLV